MKQFFFAFLVISLFACGTDDSGSGDQCNPDFDQQEFFRQITEENILSNYSELNVSINQLYARNLTFITSPSEAHLISLREAFVDSYHAWQKVAQFEFGPAKEVFLRNSVNNFPLNEADVLENVQTGVYNFQMPDKYDKGFPALDFLLYGLSENTTDIVNVYLLGANAANYRNYLSAVVEDILTRVNFTYEKWSNEYLEVFVNNSGTAAGTSLSLIVNGFNENYELIKREKLGIPSGVLTLNIPNPDRVEAIHSGISTTLLQTALEATINLFNNGLGDYLNAANAAKNDALLSDIIATQFETTHKAINQLSAPLNEEIENNPEDVINAYNEISRQLVNIKTDMPSMLCVSITYIDNPSDSD